MSRALGEATGSHYHMIRVVSCNGRVSVSVGHLGLGRMKDKRRWEVAQWIGAWWGTSDPWVNRSDTTRTYPNPLYLIGEDFVR